MTGSSDCTSCWLGAESTSGGSASSPIRGERLSSSDVSSELCENDCNCDFERFAVDEDFVPNELPIDSLFDGDVKATPLTALSRDELNREAEVVCRTGTLFVAIDDGGAFVANGACVTGGVAAVGVAATAANAVAGTLLLTTVR